MSAIADGRASDLIGQMDAGYELVLFGNVSFVFDQFIYNEYPLNGQKVKRALANLAG